MKQTKFILLAIITNIFFTSLHGSPYKSSTSISRTSLNDKIKGGWAGQILGCTYGGPTEFRYVGTIMQDSIPIPWSDKEVEKWYNNAPGLYDDIYVDLTFVNVFEKNGIDAPIDSFSSAFANAGYPLCHANQMARYNLMQGIKAPACGHWKNNPHADCIDFQIEADFAGIMSPGMPNTASEICDKVGHIMSYGDGWYGGVYVAAMYSLAFISDDINFVVSEALKTIPQKSNFHQCMLDVINWHKEFPNDWKRTWLEIEKKWSEDYACPDGVHVPFNIESKINAAYIILGLLYGEGDFFKTMDISTRAGQDSDCNPASAAGILGTLLGYSKIPAVYSQNLNYVADRPFSHTDISFNKACELSIKHALQLITKNGGKYNNSTVTIPIQKPQEVRFEESFQGLKLIGKELINQSVTTFKSFDFKGTGLVIKGMVQGSISNDYIASVDILLNGKVIENCKLPLFFDHRKHEIFFNYELPKGSYTVTCKWNNPEKGVDVWLTEAILYTNK